MKLIVENIISHGSKLNLLPKKDQNLVMIFQQAFVEINGGGYNLKQPIMNTEVALDQSIWINQDPHLTVEEDQMVTLIVTTKSITGKRIVYCKNRADFIY